MEIGKGYKVLIVEDVKVAQKVAMIILVGLGCKVDIAETGTQAIELVSKSFYDIIFMDLGLPDMNGLTVAETIRKIEAQNKRTIIIALSAHSENAEGLNNRELCLKAGMDDYLEKPLTKELTLKILQKFFHNK